MATAARLTVRVSKQAGCVLAEAPRPETPVPSAQLACTRTMQPTPQHECLAVETGRRQAMKYAMTETLQAEMAEEAIAWPSRQAGYVQEGLLHRETHAPSAPQASTRTMPPTQLPE